MDDADLTLAVLGYSSRNGSCYGTVCIGSVLARR
jgi:hypothetical protein